MQSEKVDDDVDKVANWKLIYTGVNVVNSPLINYFSFLIDYNEIC